MYFLKFVCKTCCLLQLRILARDQGTPQQTGTATVYVTVSRNRYAPSFQSPESYTATIAETFTPSVAILTISANDQDPEVSSYLCSGRFHLK